MDELKRYDRDRMRHWREYKRLLSALQCLFDSQVLPEDDFEELQGKIKAGYDRECSLRKITKPKNPRGRGRPAQVGSLKCRKEGCPENAKPGFWYCSREHAPLGMFGVSASKAGGGE